MRRSCASLNPSIGPVMLLLAAYVILMLLNPQLGPGDEYHFLPTLQSGKPFPLYGADFPYYSSVELGRFSPLGGQEYNLVGVFTNSPLGYFAFNALEMVSCVFLLAWVLRRHSTSAALVYLSLAALLLTPGFTLAFFKLLYVEKNVLFLLAAFMASYLLFQRQSKPIYLALTLLCANVAIYYKEPVFAAIAVFAAGHLLLAWRDSGTSSRLLDGLLIASALLYAGIYLFVVWPQRGPVLYAPALADASVLAWAKNFANYAFFSDPIPLLLLLPLLLWRLFRVFGRGEAAHPLLDPMLAAGAAYVGVFLVLNMYSPYYLLPAYVFALPPAIHFMSRLRNFFWKACLGATALVLVFNAIPLAIHYIAYNKYVPVNFNRTMDFLVDDINRRYVGERLNIFFDGVDRGAGRGTYFIAGEYLKFKGLSLRKFDFKSDIEARDATPPVGRASPFDNPDDVRAVDPGGAYAYPQFPYSVYQPGPLPRVASGDYLVVSPQATRNFDDRYLSGLEKNYEMVFRTHSPLAVPRFDLKTLVKYFLSRSLEPARKSQLMLNENLWNWPDYYVFRRR